MIVMMATTMRTRKIQKTSMKKEVKDSHPGGRKKFRPFITLPAAIGKLILFGAVFMLMYKNA